jgi:hypothetical protein
LRARASLPIAWPMRSTIARGRERLADDAADVVGLEDFGWQGGGSVQAVILDMFWLFVAQMKVYLIDWRLSPLPASAERG